MAFQAGVIPESRVGQLGMRQPLRLGMEKGGVTRNPALRIAQVDEGEMSQHAAVPGTEPVNLHVVETSGHDDRPVHDPAHIIQQGDHERVPLPPDSKGVPIPLQEPAVKFTDHRFRSRHLRHRAVIGRLPGLVLPLVAAAAVL